MGAEPRQIVISIESMGGAGAEFDAEERDRIIRSLRRQLREAGAEVTSLPAAEAPEGTRAGLGMATQLLVEIPLGFTAHLVAGIIYDAYSGWRQAVRARSPEGASLDLSSRDAVERELAGTGRSQPDSVNAENLKGST